MARLIRCPNCGANVDVTAAQSLPAIACTFCESTISLATAPPAQPAAPRFHPPFPSHARVSSPRSLLLVPIVAFLALFVGGLALYITRSAGRAASRSTEAPPIAQDHPDESDPAPAKNNKLPARCNDTIVIEDQTLQLKETAIVADANCKIVIRRSNLRAPKVIEGGANVEITIVDSTITGDAVAIELGMNGTLRVSGKSVIKARNVAIDATSNADIRLDGAHVEATDGTAIVGEMNAKIDARSSKIIGKIAFDLAMNGTVTLRETEVRGDKKLEMNGKIIQK